MKKILIITPRSPFQGRGADEQDRLAGIKWFIRKGWDVRVVTKTMEGDIPHIDKAKSDLGIEITPVSYKFRGRKDIAKRLFNPRYWDGAAYEYFEPEIQNAVKNEIESFEPDLVWFDYTYLWPLYEHARRRNIPVITRSINFESEHFLDEDGRSILNYLRAVPKYASEKKSFRLSDYFFAITPKEEKMYRELGTTPVATLPLRALPERVIERKRDRHEEVRIGFMPSTYTVSHNREALNLIISALRLLPERIKQGISVRITGQKFPEAMREKLPREIVYEGFVPSSVEFWQRCDIAIAPSVFGCGMQQKIFEPITLGVPTITARRGIAGYPFECGKEILCAHDAREIAASITELVEHPERRDEISKAAQKLASGLFSQVRVDAIIDEGLRTVLK